MEFSSRGRREFRFALRNFGKTKSPGADIHQLRDRITSCGATRNWRKKNARSAALHQARFRGNGGKARRILISKGSKTALPFAPPSRVHSHSTVSTAIPPPAALFGFGRPCYYSRSPVCSLLVLIIAISADLSSPFFQIPDFSLRCIFLLFCVFCQYKYIDKREGDDLLY